MSSICIRGAEQILRPPRDGLGKLRGGDLERQLLEPGELTVADGLITEIDFVLKCVAPDLKTFQTLVEKLTSGPHVRNVKTSMTLRQSKDAAMVPMG